ncbi:MAG TPA: helix-turn-helix domain-containing protein [Propionicimonas sp.]
MTISSTAPPWSRLPIPLAAVMAPHVGRIQAEILELIDAEEAWTERMASPKVRADLVAATGSVVSRFVALIGTEAPTFTGPDRARFRELGAGEAREGRGLEDLLAAYRVGTRVLYTEVAEALSALDPSPAAQVALGESVFALVDALQAESAEGYANEVSTHAGERERRLRRLLEALLHGEEDEVRGVSAQVGWAVPSSVVVVVAALEAIPEVRSGVHPGFVVERDGAAVVVLPADQGVGGAVDRLSRLVRAVRPDAPALKVGPVVPLLQARRSWATAHLLADRPGGEPLLVVDWLPELLTRGAPEVAATLGEHVLAPLDALKPLQRERLTATLGAWLEHWGQRSAIAAQLAIHPQTVAYRVNQLRDVFGNDLDDTRWRLSAQLALLGRLDAPRD